MTKVDESVLSSLGKRGQEVDMLPGLGERALLSSVAMTGQTQGSNAAHPLFGVDPIVVLAALVACFFLTSFLQSKY